MIPEPESWSSRSSYDCPVKKYLLVPDYVWSDTDDDRHWISAAQLVRLYGVPLSECLVWSDAPWFRPDPTLIRLRPLFGGGYREKLARLELEKMPVSIPGDAPSSEEVSSSPTIAISDPCSSTPLAAERTHSQ